MFSQIFFASLVLVLCVNGFNDKRVRPRVPDSEDTRPRHWPQVVGMTVQEAKDVISADRPEVFFKELSLDPGASFCYDTLDYRPNRVSLCVNDQGIVTETPSVG